MLVAKTFWKSRRAGCMLLALLTLAFFADLLFGANDRILSKIGTDVWRQFAGWRMFGFEQLRQGNFPFWTPLVYSGIPYFSGFQSGLLYPPNWLHLLLPLPKAINWGIALHVWWLGSGMLLWMHALGRSQAASLFCAVLLMFCAPHFLHIFAGHLTNLCVMAWVPWLMLAISRWRDGQKLKWAFAGAGVVAMEILAGHPQYVYFGAIASALYAGLLLFAKGNGRIRFVIGFAMMYLLAALMTAVQLAPGIEALGESLRGGGDKNFSGMYSFPPENILTLLAPTLFGDSIQAPYWGRWFLWEAAAFFGVIGLWCALIGAVWGKNCAQRWTSLAMAGGCVLLGFGSYTPLFDVMYALVPGYDLFRGSAKFIFFATLFAVALAGMGLDMLLAGKEKLAGEKALVGAGFGVVLLLGMAALSISISAAAGELAVWSGFRQFVWQTGEVTHLPENAFFGAELAPIAAQVASQALWLATAMLVLAVACTALRHSRRWLVYLMLGVGMVEILAFAAHFRQSFRYAQLLPSAQTEFRATHPGDFRVVDLTIMNGGMLSAMPDLWGDDPGVLRRYAQFMAATQSVHPDMADQHLEMKAVHPLWDLLRFAYVFEPTPEGARPRGFNNAPMKRFELFANYEVVVPERRVLARLFMAEFNPRSVVLLEEPPNIAIPPRPGESVRGHWRIEREDSDEVVVRVNVEQPCVLLMTDPYSRGWQAESLLPDPPQLEYIVQPGDFMLRALPLAKGEHHIRIFFLPRTFKAAAAVSGLVLLMWAIGLFWIIREERKKRTPRADKIGNRGPNDAVRVRSAPRKKSKTPGRGGR